MVVLPQPLLPMRTPYVPVGTASEMPASANFPWRTARLVISITSSCQEFLDQLPVDVGEAEVAALRAEGELGVVDAEQMEDGGVQVVDVNAVLDGVEAEVV